MLCSQLEGTPTAPKGHPKTNHCTGVAAVASTGKADSITCANHMLTAEAHASRRTRGNVCGSRVNCCSKGQKRGSVQVPGGVMWEQPTTSITTVLS